MANATTDAENKGRSQHQAIASPFYQGVQDKSPTATIIIDTKILNKDTLKTIAAYAGTVNSADELLKLGTKDKILDGALVSLAKEIKQQLELQGIKPDKNWDDKTLLKYTLETLYDGSHAYNVKMNNQNSCLVTNMPYEVMLAATSALPSGFPLKPFLGKTENYERIVGRHEQSHCGDRNNYAGISAVLADLRREVNADAGMFKDDMTDMTRERNDLLNVRILGFVHGKSSNVSHITPFFLDEKGSITMPTESTIYNLNRLKYEMMDAVTNMTGNKDVSEHLFKENPLVFAAFVQEAIKQDKLTTETDAEMKRFMERYVKAVAEQVYDTSDPAANPANKAKKAAALTLSDVMNTTNPIIVQGSGVQLAQALKSIGQNAEIQRVTETEIGEVVTPQQILVAALDRQQKQNSPSLSAPLLY